jgi:RNA recognition motif-containing protein
MGLFSGKNKRHGEVIFSDVINVNKLMNNRPHQIDGVQVEIYRAVPNQESLVKNKEVTNLIVTGITNKLNESDLEIYFEKYGKINYIDMKNGDNYCRIEFDE